MSLVFRASGSAWALTSVLGSPFGSNFNRSIGKQTAMTLGGILILVLLVISLAVFVYLLVITSRSWGVLHTVLLSFLFIECWTFLLLSGQVLDYRLTSLKAYHETTEKLTKVRKEIYTLTWGGNTISEEQQAIVSLSGAVRRLTADRGRVWRGATKINIENGQAIRLQLASPNAEGTPGEDLSGAPAPAQPPADSVATIPLDMVVYAFSETRNEQNQSVPQYYLGEYKVIENNAGQALLRPTIPLEKNQLEAVNQEVMWSLYELLPQDSHETFVAEGAQPSEDFAFGRMDDQLINSLFEGVPEARRAEVINTYLRDGTPALDTDLPRNVWLKIEAVKPIELDVDSEEQANATVGGYFDASGRTVDVRIKREEKKVTLPEGRQVLLPQEKLVRDLIDRGDAKLIQRVFVRPLNGYEKGFGQLRARRDEVSRSIELVDRSTAILKEADALGNAMTSEQQVQSQKLTADLEKTKQEVAVLDSEIQVIAKKLEQTRNYVIKLYKDLHAAHDQQISGG